MISTGYPELDEALGTGGLPEGRIIEVFGPESSGKTSLGFKALASCQKQGKLGLYIDLEFSFNKELAQSCGVNLASLVVYKPKSAGELFVSLDKFLRCQTFGVIVIDSIAAIHAENVDLAKSVHEGLYNIKKILAESKTSLICINQIRADLNSHHAITTPGGYAIKFYSTIRMGLHRNAKGVTANIIKNKAYPFMGEVFCGLDKELKHV